MSNQKNNFYNLITDKRTVPFNETGTGTIETNKLGIIGTGTAFKTELKRGAWIVDLTNNEIRKVESVESDTYAILVSAFSTDIAAASPLDYIPAWKGNAREISIIIPLTDQGGTANDWGQVDGEDFPPGLPYTISKSSRDDSSVMDVVNPIIVDATDTQMGVTQLF